jgi:hypothetical protein
MPMLRPEELTWTSRAEVCAQLAEFVRQTPPAPCSSCGSLTPAEPDLRLRAAALLATLADESCVPVLRHLLGDRREEQFVRLEVLWALSRLRATLPGGELERLLEDRALWEDAEGYDHLGLPLELFRSSDELQTATRFLAGLSAEKQAELLLRCAYNDQSAVAPTVVEWLYNAWLNQGRFLLEESQHHGRPLNALVAIATSDRPASRALLVDDWRRADGDHRRALLEELKNEENLLEECLAGDPASTQQLSETFSLPCKLLVEHFGSEHLLSQVEQEIRAVSSAFRADLTGGSARWHDRLRQVIRLLEKWPNAGIHERLCSLAACPDLHFLVRHDLGRVLWERLWEQDRLQALAVAMQAADRASDFSLAHSALLRIADDPDPGHRDFLLWVTAQQEEPQFRYEGLQALEMLGEDSSAWRERVNELSRDENPLIRLQATAALVRRGDATRLDQVIRDATEVNDVLVRAEALQVLGELDAERHVALFRHALLEDHELWDDHYAPAAEEAAYVLACLGTVEALTALIQGCLVAPHSVWSALCWYLDSIREQIDGRDVPVSLHCINWRRERFRRW